MVGLVFASPFGYEPLQPPSGQAEGVFDGVPVADWVVRLPGKPWQRARSELTELLVEGDLIYVGSSRTPGLFALNRRDGLQAQVFESDGVVQARALRIDDRVIFSDLSGKTWAYRTSGELIWTHDSGGPIVSSGLVVDDLLVISNVHDLVVAIELETGKMRWRHQHNSELIRQAELELFAGPSAIRIGETIVLGFSDGTLLGVERTTGDVSWTKLIGEGHYPDIVASALAVDDILLASGYFSPTVGLKADDLSLSWRIEAGAAHSGVVFDGHVVLPGTDGKLRRIDPKTGQLTWEWSSGGTGALSQPIWTEAGLLVASADGGLFLVDAASGQTRWEYEGPTLLSGIASRPVIDGSQLLFVTQLGNLYSMRVPQRSEWRRTVLQNERLAR